MEEIRQNNQNARNLVERLIGLDKKIRDYSHKHPLIALGSYIGFVSGTVGVAYVITEYFGR